jgi:hypothetical protein
VRYRKAETLLKGLEIMQLWIVGKHRTGGLELQYVVVVLAMPSGCWISTFPHVYADTAYHCQHSPREIHTRWL